MDLNNLNNIKLGVIGCGKMAKAILSAVVNNKYIDSNLIYAYDINSDACNLFCNELNFNKTSSIQELLNLVDVVLLAVKPFVVNNVLDEIKSNYNNQLVLSILAGVKLEKYTSVIPNINIVRIMPNTPALVNAGMSAICDSNEINGECIDFAYNFMKNCGQVVRVSEDKMDIITALSGSGPAYYYKLIELMASAAHKIGLDYKQALLLSAQTALGSAKMVLDNDFNINQLIKNVTTPGGCTEVGNNVLNNSNISDIIDKTISDTAQKAFELG